MKKILTTTRVAMFLLIGMFLISLTSAMDWDNQLTYNNNNKQVNIKNLFGLGADYGTLTITSHEDLSKPIYVGTGYQRVLIQEIDSKQDYNNFIGTPLFKNMKTDELEELIYYWEKAIYGDVEVNDYKDVCGEIYNITSSKNDNKCENKLIGTHTEKGIISWEKFTDFNIKKNEKITLALVVYVNSNTNYDGIPKFFGKEISNWAAWTNDLNVDLKYYYQMNETSGTTTIDYMGNQNGTTNATVNGNGKIGSGYYFFKTNYVNITGATTGTTWSISVWIKPSTWGAGEPYIIRWETPLGIVGIRGGFNTIGIYDGSWKEASTNKLAPNEWTHVVVTSVAGNHTIWQNGTVAYSVPTGTAISMAGVTKIGGTLYNGTIDEFGIWDRTLSASEITQLYNSGNGITPLYITTPAVTIVYPTAVTYSTTILDLNYTATSSGTLDSCWYSLNLGQTNSSRQNCGVNWSSLTATEESNTWIVYANTTTGEFNSNNVTFNIDTSPSIISIISGNGTINYGNLNINHTIVYNISDFTLQTCWIDYNLTNITIPCSSGDINTTNFILQKEVYSAILYANDTIGHLENSTINWDYKIFANSITYTESTFETATENYAINVTANSSLTAVKLIYNNESGLTMTNQGSNYWSLTRDVPIGNGSFNFYYNFTYGGSYISSTNSTQEINLTYFTPTDATYTDIFLNISFQDENSLTAINASIPSSSFIYYLGSGIVNKTLEFINNTDNLEYTFSGTTGSNDLYVIPIVQYRRVNDYPQRIWTPTTRTYNSTQTDQVLNLLSSTDGIYVTYQVLGITDQPLEGVEVTATRLVSGETIQVGAGTTDAAGTVTFWMNPDFQHIVTFSKTGYDDYVFTHFPTQASYTITLGSTTTTEVSLHTGISFVITPQNSFLYQNTIHDFSLSLSSTYWDLDEFGFSLLRDSGALIGSNISTNSSGGTLYLYDVNTSNSESIYMNAYYVIDGETTLINLPRYWTMQSTNGTEYSIYQLSQDLDRYILSDLYGFDNFGRRLFSIIILIVMVGGISRRYGIASEASATGLIFSVVFLLDVGFNFIPQITVPFTGFALPSYSLTAITFVILLSVLIWETFR